MPGRIKPLFCFTAIAALTGSLLSTADAETHAKAALKSPIKTVVFAPIVTQANPAPSDEMKEGVKATLAVALHQTGRFIVLESPAEAGAAPGKVRVGQTVSPQVRVQITIMQAVNNESKSGSVENIKIKGGPFGSNRIGGSVQVKASKLRLLVEFVEVKTGRRLFSVEGAGESKVVGGSADLGYQPGNGGPLDLPNVGVESNGKTQSLLPIVLSNNNSIVKFQQFHNSSMGSATEKASNKVVQNLSAQMDQQLWEAQIAEVFQGHIFVNAGTMEGLKPGDRFTLSHAKTSPAGTEAEEMAAKVGQVEIIKADTHFSEARLIEGAEAKRGDIVRVAP